VSAMRLTPASQTFSWESKVFWILFFKKVSAFLTS
jgi:hypothetical protein